MAVGGEVLAAPLPGLDVRALAAGDAVERASSAAAMMSSQVSARLGAEVVAPLRPVAQDAQDSGTSAADIAEEIGPPTRGASSPRCSSNSQAV